jgi:cytochrome c oxidase subunit 1
VTLTILGICYWLVPYLSGRALFSRNLALLQVVLWIGGMYMFSHGMHTLGIDGMPRRTMISQAPYLNPAWATDLKLVGIGGTILFVSALLFFANVLLTAFVSRASVQEMPAFAETKMAASPRLAGIFDRWWIWIAVVTGLIVFTYAPTLIHLWTTTPLDVAWLRVW